jgi:hypothetical protein
VQPIRNFCIVEPAAGYDSFATQIALVANDGLKLPNPALEGPFNLVWFNFTDYKNPSDDPYKEIIKVIASENDKLTIIRAQERTNATIKNIAGKVYKLILTLTKESYDAIVPGIHGVISTIEDGNITPESLGENAIDFQFQRSDKTQSATGSCSFISGGRSNRASGAFSFVANAYNTASGQNSTVIGSENISSGENSFVFGSLNIASNENTLAFGTGSKARLIGQVAWANSFNSQMGDAQYSSFILKTDTVGLAASELSLKVLGGTKNKLILEDNTAYCFKAFILGSSFIGSCLSVGYEVKGLIERGDSASSTQIVGNVNVERISDLSQNCDVNVQADCENGALQIVLTGEDKISMHWICFLEWLELKRQ